MAKVQIELKGVAVEIVLGNYMPTDPTIMKDWQEFFHYNDLIHESQLLADYISEIAITVDEKELYKGKVPGKLFHAQKSFTPVLIDQALYLRTECAEEAVFSVEFETPAFDKNKLVFETQDYDMLFKTGKDFVSSLSYEGQMLELVWKSAKPLGQLCLLCKFQNGYLVPVYDAVKKVEAPR